jgi:xylulokinase
VAGATLNWLRDNVIYPDDALRQTTAPDNFYLQLDNVAASAPAGSNGVIFTPWLNGERTPVDDHRLRGGWHDLSLQTTRADLVRSVLEGVAYNSRWLLGYVEKFTGKPFPALNFIGGGAQSRLWCRIMADVLDRPIRQVEHPIRANARGAAAIAALALGQTTIDDVARSVDIEETFHPDPSNRRVYDELYKEFRNFHKQTKAIYGRLHNSH